MHQEKFPVLLSEPLRLCVAKKSVLNSNIFLKKLSDLPQGS
jgi:hypothetical protein